MGDGSSEGGLQDRLDDFGMEFFKSLILLLIPFFALPHLFGDFIHKSAESFAQVTGNIGSLDGVFDYGLLASRDEFAEQTFLDYFGDFAVTASTIGTEVPKRFDEPAMIAIEVQQMPGVKFDANVGHDADPPSDTLARLGGIWRRRRFGWGFHERVGGHRPPPQDFLAAMTAIAGFFALGIQLVLAALDFGVETDEKGEAGQIGDKESQIEDEEDEVHRRSKGGQPQVSPRARRMAWLMRRWKRNQRVQRRSASADTLKRGLQTGARLQLR
ncbi:MAG: hypothetical protein HY360_07515 [Verrucomicrobia bacterium]|nr:hypothetical protein [Verrucomicrobiota bacterium]